MLLELFFGLVTLVFVWDYFNKYHRNALLKAHNITGPKALPIIGCTLELRGVNANNLLQFNIDNKKKYGKIFRLWVFQQLTVIVMDIKLLEAVLINQQTIKKGSLYNLLTRWLGTGLLLSTGKKWHTRRKIITPTFHFKILEQFVDVFDHNSSIMVKKLAAKADGKTAIDIFPVVCLSALDIIAETAMGVKVHAQEKTEMEYVQALAYVANLMANRFIKPVQRVDWRYRLIYPKEYKKMVESIEVMHKFTRGVIEERRKALESSIAQGTYQPFQSEGEGCKKRMALLDVLLQSTVEGHPLSNEDIREEVDTFMFEGHDTTTSAVSFALYSIARHPEVQKKLVQEILEVIGEDRHKQIGIAELQQMKYMECVIKETLRLYPSVPQIAREITEDVQLGDVVIPAKTNLTLSFFMSQRDPDYFENPHDFIPERFSAENIDKVNSFAFTPFSAGPRNCIGQKFALLEMKSTISKMLRHFELMPLGPEIKLVFNLIYRSSTGIHIGLKPRTTLEC